MWWDTFGGAAALVAVGGLLARGVLQRHSAPRVPSTSAPVGNYLPCPTSSIFRYLVLACSLLLGLTARTLVPPSLSPSTQSPVPAEPWIAATLAAPDQRIFWEAGKRGVVFHVSWQHVATRRALGAEHSVTLQAGGDAKGALSTGHVHTRSFTSLSTGSIGVITLLGPPHCTAVSWARRAANSRCATTPPWRREAHRLRRQPLGTPLQHDSVPRQGVGRHCVGGPGAACGWGRTGG